MNKNFRFISLALSFMLCFTAVAFGQKTTGSIEGTITDTNGANVPGVTVKVTSSGTTAGYSATTTTNDDGYFAFSQIPVGSYTVTTAKTGFESTRQEVIVVIDRSAQANTQLKAGIDTTVVDVNADSSVTIDPTDTKIDTNITKQVFDNLPKGTQFSNILKIAPNVRPEALAGGFQIDGASGSENVFVIDGQEVTNFRTGSLNSNFNLPFELVQEVQIKSTGYEAEYGGATGGVINVVTQGGNDSWRGNFGISFRPLKLQGDRRPFLNRYATGVGGFEYFNQPSDGGTDWFPVAQVSGPVVKGKLWFSAIYAPQIFDNTRTIDYFGSANPNVNRTPLETITYSQNQKQEEAFFRVDAQPFSRLRVYGTFLWNPIVQDGLLPAATEGLSAPQSVNFGGSIGSLRGSELLSRQGGRQNANAVNGQATWNPTNYLILNFRYGRSFLNEKLGSYFLPRVTRYICSALGPLTPAQTGCSQGFQNVASNAQINFDASTRTTFDADASFVGINAGGRHNFKFGYQYNRLFNTVSNGYRDLGIIQLFYDRDISVLCGCDVPPTPGNLGSGLMTRFGTVGEASSDNQALFVQDTWQVNNRLTFNLGVRIEKEVVPNFGDTTNTSAIEFNWGDKISPRIGVAFDLTGDGKTKLFANYGQFYDRFKYELPRGSFGGDFFRRDFFEVLPPAQGGVGTVFTNYNLNNIIGSYTDPIGGDCPIVNPTGLSRCQFDFRIATNIEGADIFQTGAIDPNIKAARQSEWTIGLERQLWQNFLLSARYTHKQVDRAIEDIGLFTPSGSEAYVIGNPGFGTACEVADLANFPCPKAERTYDALEVRVDKRATKYFFNASYTFSRLFGNYSGLASSDEAGRTSPNVNRFFDLPPLGFNANGEPDNGRLATDRPHVFKAYGGYSFDWAGNGVNRTTVSAFTTIQSGTPLTTIYNLYSLGTTILFGRGDLGRTEMFTETDIFVSHRYKFGRDNRFTFEPYIEVRNMFDEDNVLGAQTNISGTNFSGGGATTPLRVGGCPAAACGSEGGVFNTIFNGGGIQQYVLNFIQANGISSAGTLNTYGLANTFQAPRDVRFGFRFYF